MTNQNFQINLRSIECFKHISDSILNSIESESKIIKYGIGDLITQADIIPDKILLILSGQVRLTTNNSTDARTIEKLKAGKFIGLASFLKAIPCESTSAIDEVKVLSITDKLILTLLESDSHFKNWCYTNIEPIELYELFTILVNKEEDKNYNFFKNKLRELISIEVINNGEILKTSNDTIKVIGSNNVIDEKTGEITTINKKIYTRGLLPARILSINKDGFNIDLSTSTRNRRPTKAL